MVKKKLRFVYKFDWLIRNEQKTICWLFVYFLVIRARQLSFQHPDNHSLNTFVKVKFCQYEQCSKIIYGTNSPVYDEKFLM
jgi:hypothetical protein